MSDNHNPFDGSVKKSIPAVRSVTINLDNCEFQVARAGFGKRGQALDDLLKDLDDSNFKEKFPGVLKLAMGPFYSEDEIDGFIENDLIGSNDLHIVVAAMRGADLDAFKKKVLESD